MNNNIKKIQSMIMGNNKRPQVGYVGKTIEQRKEDEKWIDANGYEWIKENGKRKQITNVPGKGFNKCKDCNKLILKQRDEDTYNRMQRCFICQIDFENDLYKFFRRFVLFGFIIFEIIAQALLVINMIKAKPKIQTYINKKVLILKIILVSVLIIVAFLSAPILNSTEYTLFKHALEWNYFLGVVTFYLLTFLFWKKNKLEIRVE